MSGKEAIEMVQQAYSLNISYQIIFTDFSMPDIDGIQATSKIRNILSKDHKILKEN